MILLLSMAPSPLHARPQVLVITAGAGAGALALTLIPAIVLGTAAATTGGLLAGLNLGGEMKRFNNWSEHVLNHNKKVKNQ